MLLIVPDNFQKIKHKHLKRAFYVKILHMGIIVNLDDERSQLQKRIAAELKRKNESGNKAVVKIQKANLEPEDVDGVEDSVYIKGYTKSKTLNLDKTWLILIGGGVVVVVIVIILALIG